MKCYYELLGVEKDVDSSELKTAYRKQALKWHPDKNPDNVDEAKLRFQLLQQAYEVLSDAHERAWYDKHREQILRGAHDTNDLEEFDVFSYFSSACYHGYNDDANGFYTVYRNVFENIHKEDVKYAEDGVALHEAPSFGSSNSDYDSTVRVFYAYWMDYTTRKSYAWTDAFNVLTTKDRRVAKAMERENKKSRARHKRERNEEIRNLVAFVHKRDRRVQAQRVKSEAQRDVNRRKQEEKRVEKLRMRAEEIEADKVNEQEWVKFDNVKAQLDVIEQRIEMEFGDGSDDESVVDDLYCVACNKVFKTERSFANHESSRKHKENLKRVREEMLEEEEGYDNDEEEVVDDILECEVDEPVDPEADVKENVTNNDSVGSESNDSESDGSEPNGSDSNGLFDPKLIESLASSSKQRKKQQNVDKLLVNLETSTKKSRKKKDKPAGVQQTQQDERREKPERARKSDRTSDGLNCGVCQRDFTSKNKLFDHLKTTGHYLMKDVSGKSVKDGKKSRKTRN